MALETEEAHHAGAGDSAPEGGEGPSASNLGAEREKTGSAEQSLAQPILLPYAQAGYSSAQAGYSSAQATDAGEVGYASAVENGHASAAEDSSATSTEETDTAAKATMTGAAATEVSRNLQTRYGTDSGKSLEASSSVSKTESGADAPY